MGYQAVQSTHAAINFIFEHQDRAGPWHESNYLVQLSVANEKELEELIGKCQKAYLALTIFKEPDIDNQITAICIEPSKLTQKIVKKLPLLYASL